MPGLNKKGPDGKGPMTGRRMGRCNPDNKGKTDEEIMKDHSENNQEQGNFFSRGRGLGRGRRFGKGLGKGMGLRFRGNE